MSSNTIPYTYENSSNPWLMDPKDLSDVIVIDDHKITAEYMWSLNIEERTKLLYKVYDYYVNRGFPCECLSSKYISNQFKKLCEYDTSKVMTSDGFVSNSGNLCLDVCRYYCRDKFYKARGDNDSRSIEDVFHNKDMFIKVLKNRMGWNTTKEDGTERPYLFAITDKQIINGIRNSGLGYGVSNFRPTIAKFIFERYLSDRKNPLIFDYSGGWGARALAAISLGYRYVATDPYTYNNINTLISDISDKCYNGFCYNSASENPVLYQSIEDKSVDMCFSCPPYFTLERYSWSDRQCYNKHNNFVDWIEEYWRSTVKNCKRFLKDDGYFGLVIKDFYEKYPLKDEMNRILEEEGFMLKDSYQYKTSTNHLSGKKKSGKVNKNSEWILIYELHK